MNLRNRKLILTIVCVLMIVIGLGSRIYSYSLSISNYPLATDWSESGRIFEAAAIYSPIVFGKALPWPWLDPGKAILEGLVLLIPGSQIWMYRFWLVLLSVFATAFTSILILRTVWNKSPQKEHNQRNALLPIALVAWGILYVLQCPIYYHVLLGAILVLWLLNLDKPIITLIAVIIASAWEGLCRVNWFFMPALLVVTIYFLSVPVTGRKLFRYLLWPFIWCISGTLVSLITYYLFIKLSNHVIPFFNLNMHYGFFRFKLWPNNAFKLGLIPGVILLSAPIIGIVLVELSRIIRKVHWIRWSALVIILVVLFVGSTIVSLRAGGGFDLHNYDTFALILFVFGIYCGLGAVRLDKLDSSLPRPLLDNRFVLIGLLSVPMFFALGSIHAPKDLPVQEAKDSIQQLQTIIQETNGRKSPILFIDNRHLLVYNTVPPVELYMPYEKIDLMEMAMANNNPYLNQFWEDIKGHKFSLIVSEKLQLAKQDINSPLGYENNVWVASVSDPILRYYRPIYQGSGFVVYSPKLGAH